MSKALEQYRPIFVQQRLYNYSSLVVALAAIGGAFLLTQLDLSIAWLMSIAFSVFYINTIVSSRVRTNPLVRCTIENADERLYNNLWGWSVLASAVSIAGFIVVSIGFWVIEAPALSINLYVILVAAATVLMITAAVE